MNVSDYHSYYDLPPLAGLATIDEASRPGLSVEECVRRLKIFHYAFARLHEIFTARITAEPIYELKTAFSHHAYLCAEHVAALRDRVAEMREPPLGLEDVPDDNLQVFFDEILAAPTTEELFVALYETALDGLGAAIVRYMRETNPLTDAPSRRALRFALLEIGDMIDFGQKCIARLVDSDRREQMQDWLRLLERSSASFLGESASTPVARHYSAKPYRYDPIPRRDERFQDLWNQAVNAEHFIYAPEYDAKAKALMMLYKRIREIDVPEMMASIIIETKHKPWQYYLDMSRQLWDEARHAMMGEVGFVALGVDWTKARITHNWSYRLNTECTPLERHAVLYFIEQGLMTKTGKRYEWELALQSGLPLMATLQDFDWADEVLHSQIGREWLIPEIGDLKKTLEYGDTCWSRILSNWRQVRDEGLTEHKNWWPHIYLQACANWRTEPDKAALNFDVSYEEQRADLKNVTGSA